MGHIHEHVWDQTTETLANLWATELTTNYMYDAKTNTDQESL